jgi:hypothetical protein
VEQNPIFYDFLMISYDLMIFYDFVNLMAGRFCPKLIFGIRKTGWEENHLGV